VDHRGREAHDYFAVFGCLVQAGWISRPLDLVADEARDFIFLGLLGQRHVDGKTDVKGVGVGQTV